MVGEKACALLGYWTLHIWPSDCTCFDHMHIVCCQYSLANCDAGHVLLLSPSAHVGVHSMKPTSGVGARHNVSVVFKQGNEMRQDDYMICVWGRLQVVHV